MKLSDIKEIQYALAVLFYEKLLQDGYADLSDVGLEVKSCRSAVEELRAIGSLYAGLYDTLTKGMPTKYETAEEWALGIWQEVDRDPGGKVSDMSLLEAKYIVVWVNRIIGKRFLPISPKCMEIFLDAINKSAYFGANLIGFPEVLQYEKTTIAYLPDTVVPVTAGSLSSYLEYIDENIRTGNHTFYRGHSKLNYKLLPSIMRKNTRTGRHDLLEHEERLYNELLCRVPEVFQNSRTHFERLTIMQHYGLPTRLLDITSNPLVALYFACCSNKHSLGEVIVLEAPEEKIFWPTSLETEILSALAGLPYERKSAISNIATKHFSNRWHQYKGEGISDEEFIRQCFPDPAYRELVYEMRKDGIYIDENSVELSAVHSCKIVNPVYNNQRLIRQSGLFILFGVLPPGGMKYKGKNGDTEMCYDFVSSDSYRYRVDANPGEDEGRKLLLIVKNKEKILQELKNVCIDEEHLFPDIEHAAQAMLQRI